MNKLNNLIANLCSDGVEYIPLGDILISNNALESISKKDYKDEGEIPIIDQSQTYIAAYTNNKAAIPQILPCIIFGDHTRVIKYSDKRFAQGDSGTKVFAPISNHHNTKYIFYAFCNLDIRSRGYNRHWSIVKDMKIPLPPLEIQNEIVRILDNFTDLTEELTVEHSIRRKQHDYYLNKMYEDLTKYKANLVKFHEIGIIERGNGLQKSDFVEKGVPCIHYGQIYTYFGTYTSKTKSFVSIELAKKLKKVKYGDIIIAVTSENIEDVCKSVLWLGDEEIVTGGHTGIFRHNQNPKYIAYFLKTKMFFEQKRKIAHGTKVIEVTPRKLENIVIPVPSLEEQQRIVDILDKFDKLVNDISEGIPAEIAARQKQYEYYRDKLLTFKEVGNESI